MKRRSSRSKRSNDPETHFLNVDLDVFARSSLESLASAFGSKAFRLYVGPHGNRYRAHFELRRQRPSADRAIVGLARLVADLPRSARAVWNWAYRRDFNIGIQGGLKPYSYELCMQPETLKLVSSVGARLVVTVYAADEPAGCGR